MIGFLLRRAGSAAALGALLSMPFACSAQSYPAKPIHLVVPFPPGGVADIIARPIAERIGRSLGQTVIVENRGGATGTIGAAYVANSAADGYTLLFATTNEIAMSPTLYKSLPYDPVKAFSPVMPLAEFPNVLVVGASTPADSLAKLIDLAKSRKASLSFASSGVGSTNHLTAELFKSEAKVGVLNVPYKGGGPALVDLVGGQVDAMFATLPSAINMIASGKLKAIAVTGQHRSPALPDVPTAKEAGLSGLVVTTWNGVLAPAGTPKAVIDRLHQALGEAVADPEIRQKLAAAGAEPMTGTPEAFASTIKADFDRWSEVIKRAGIEAQ
ncbi:Bug family tripartite tricarboxylate transporter substrate binding protein [Pollutimonas bauzanensis]|uniref:Tripartite-type tricarboxylate transporter, receptor component TctC n=1 Tax=Pollutimonas bauzanensis TaxID=658167 RepID=A0A1M5XSL1_9BURK|nr:tripartite tricarboxylate transporter substrate binding protein [Pollutimonas bauzanensis]SHI02791.1 Tripartite-type tricarboxylate transporter, receptor component TctC [Pollutimonas bauzanensis]